jgi:hypothetical protein
MTSTASTSGTSFGQIAGDFFSSGFSALGTLLSAEAQAEVLQSQAELARIQAQLNQGQQQTNGSTATPPTTEPASSGISNQTLLIGGGLVALVAIALIAKG